jgi:RNA polymerase sigma-70 factor, ECF subfamily
MQKESSSKNKHIVKDVEAQFLTCYDAYADAIFRQCYFKTSDREVAKDLTQDVFAKTWDYLVQGKTVDNLKSFIFTVANNAIKDWYKKHRAIPQSAFEYDPFANFSDETQNSSETVAEVTIVLRALDSLDPRDRDVITMRFVEGIPPREIAGILGERENTISVRITRALKKLRLIIDPAQT